MAPRTIGKTKMSEAQRQKRHRDKSRLEKQRDADHRFRLMFWSVLQDVGLIEPDKLLPEMTKQD
jgi:hypothetical protein